MENTRKTRARSKSAGAPAETDVKTNAEKENVQESEANVIDDTPLETKDPKTVENNDADKMDTVSDEPPKEDETKLPETPRGARTRKRKASEMKANDSITEEESKEKKSNVEPSKEAEEPENDESKKTTEPENDKSNETTEPEKNTSNEAEEVTQITSEDILSSSEIKVEREDLTSDTDVSMRMSESEMGMPAIQTLGKGKRARIPNKRYSDIMLSPNHKPKIENGSDSEPATKPPPSPEPAPVSTKPTRTSTSSPVQGYKKSKAPTDITNPAFLKPFTLGWKRELVWRATSDSSQKGKRSGDIYYYTPSGKKVRSMREVSENLKSKDGLTLENFSFTKEPIGLDDPEKEVIRDAKYKAGSGMAKKVLTKKAPSARNSPKVLSPKLNSPKVTSPKAMIPNETADSPPKATPKGNDSPPKTTPKGNAKGLGNFKIKLPGKKAEKKKSEEEMDVEAPPAKQAATTPSTRRSAKWAKQTPEVTPPAPPKKKLRVAKQNNGAPLSSDKNVEGKFMEHYLQNLSYGYSTLLYVFQYLKVQDLLRAGCVCTMWRDVAGHSSLWRTVRMKNSQVHSFDGLADTLKKHGTGHLDLRKMLLPSGGDEIWPRFSQAISRVDTLRKIELCRCPASVVEQLALSNPQLEVINAVTIKCEVMSLEALGSLTKIKELRIKSTNGLTLTSDIDSLRNLNTIQHISLTSIKDLYKLNLGVIAELKNLESLDLGECNDFPSDFGENVLVKLENLEKLRLEKGQGKCHTFEMLSAVKEMKKLEQLELVNFDIKSGFDKALGACCNVKKLLIIPTYISQSATTNHMVLGGVLRLHKTLSHFVWGVTLELLRVTELFVDQCEEPASKDKKEKKPAGNGDSIPVLKPVPLITEKDDEIAPAHDPPQVEILPLPNLQKLLLQSLPTTRVKILKIPFHATWRQSITDSVN
ncbi:unnamed protein product [Brassicogethes aeneus]|uniref:MBD domain-containing protein n=1 Tax=Brassicogethes aeneus TaxID=1431903 RepID=A0A9P0BDM8_BRAAE|nr:unnamed protein product [Brassicogethes aeneus]